MSTSRYAKQSFENLETVLWQGLQVAVPVDWEILRFRKARKAGFLLWADRYGFRFQLSWQRRSSARNEEEVCRDYIGKSYMADSSRKVEHSECIGDWSGVLTQFAERREGRYFRILPEENCLLEAVFVDINSENPEVVDAVLESISGISVGQEIEWRVFGLHFKVPGRFNMETCECLPATATFEFRESGEQPIHLTFNRTGMVRHWVKTDLPDWWRSQWEGRRSRVQFSRTLKKGSVTVHLEERHLRQEGAFNRIRPLEKIFSCLWIDPVDGRACRHVIKCIGQHRSIDFNSAGDFICRDIFSTRDLLMEYFDGR